MRQPCTTFIVLFLCVNLYFIKALHVDVETYVDIKKPLGMEIARGAVIKEVTEGGQMHIAGAKKGFQIVSVGGTQIASTKDFKAAVKANAKTKKMSIIFRNSVDGRQIKSS
jgi:S1-C subfamily serine protease